MAPPETPDPTDDRPASAERTSPADRLIRGLLYLTLLTPLVYAPGVYQTFVLPRAVFLRGVVGLGVLAAAWLAWRGRLPRLEVRRDPVLMALIGYLAVYVVAALTGAAPLKSLFGESYRMWGVVAWLHLLVFYLLLRGWMGPADWRRWLGGAVAVSGVVSALALVDTAGVEAVPGLAAGAGGTLGNPGYLGLYLLVCLGLIVPLWGRVGRPGRVGLAAVAALDLATILLTGNRTSLIGLAGGGAAALLAAAAWTADRGVRRRILAVLGAGVVAGGSLLGAARAGWLGGVPALEELAASRWTGRPFTIRRMGWETAVRGTLDRPALGVGPENFGLVWQEQFEPAWYDITVDMDVGDEQGRPHEYYLQRPHNAFLRAFAETGVVGGLLYLGVFVGFLLALDRARRRGGLGTREAAALLGLGVAYVIALCLWFEEWTAFPIVLAALAFAADAADAPATFAAVWGPGSGGRSGDGAAGAGAGSGVASAGTASSAGDGSRGPAAAPAGSGNLTLAVLLVALVGLSAWYHGRLTAAAWWVGRAGAADGMAERVERYERAFDLRPYGTQNMASRFALRVQSAGDEIRRRRGDTAFVEIADRAIGMGILQMGESISRDPENARLYAQQAGVYYFGGYYLFGDERFLRRAAARMETAIELAPNLLAYRHQLASLYLDADRPEEAARVLRDATAVYDGWERTHRLRAQAELAIGDTVAAGRALYHMGRLGDGWSEGERRAVGGLIVPAVVRRGKPALADSLRRMLDRRP